MRRAFWRAMPATQLCLSPSSVIEFGSKPVSEFYNGFAIGVVPIRRNRCPQDMLPVIKKDRRVVHVFPEVGFIRVILSSNRISA